MWPSHRARQSPLRRHHLGDREALEAEVREWLKVRRATADEGPSAFRAFSLIDSPQEGAFVTQVVAVRPSHLPQLGMVRHELHGRSGVCPVLQQQLGGTLVSRLSCKWSGSFRCRVCSHGQMQSVMMSPLAVLVLQHEQAASHPQYDASGPGPLTAKPRAHGGRGLTFNAVSVCDVKTWKVPTAPAPLATKVFLGGPPPSNAEVVCA